LETFTYVRINFYPCLELYLGPVIRIFTGTIITFELPGDVWTLLNIGLGGYVVGRSGESIARTLAKKGDN
jgi:hypothetical protein